MGLPTGTYTLDLNGKTLSGSNDLMIDASLTICDSQGGGKLWRDGTIWVLGGHVAITGGQFTRVYLASDSADLSVTGGTFAVRFDTDGGSVIEPTMVKHSHTVRPPSDPEKSGHTFTGWYLGDAPYDFDTPVNAPLTLTARWEEVPSSGGNYYYHPTTDTKADDTKGSPKTADPGVALYAALSLLSLTGLTCTAKKR